MGVYHDAIRAVLGLALCVTSHAALASSSVRSSRLSSNNKADRAAILELRAEHNRAIASGDAETFLKLAADNYVSIFGGGTIIRSKEELRRVWIERPQQCVRSPDQVEIGMVNGQFRAAELGKWRCDARNSERVTSGSYFAHWSKTKDGWRVVSDTYVSLVCRGSSC